jgi:DNA mismatch repair protein MutS2
MRHEDLQTIQDLEFDLIRRQVAAYSVSETASKKLLGMLPYKEVKQCIRILKATSELVEIKNSKIGFPPVEFEELHKEIKLLHINGSVLQVEGLLRLMLASDLVNEMLKSLEKREDNFPNFSLLLDDVYYTKEIIELIDKVLDPSGKIRNDASPELAEIRKEIQQVRIKINRNFDREVKKFLKMGILSDTKETYLNERRVLAVVSSHKRQVPGNVLGSSNSGNFTYIEPGVNMTLSNELEMLLDDERKEIHRILKALTAKISQFVDLVEAYQKSLVKIDYINAQARFAIQTNSALPGLEEKETCIELIDAYHPLLFQANAARGVKTMPQTLTMDKSARMLVISGPNAGGKSITLKTVGLLQMMLQSGLLVPVNPNSKMSFFHQILTDIGDNQSIENQLSTYSYRLKRMKYFLENANRRTLLLMDEFGTGSDPELGAALSEVFYEALYNKKCFGVISTHYSNIKLKTEQLRNAINACMLFDMETLTPLYQLQVGQQGSSFTFEVAQNIGIPEDLIVQAKERLGKQKVHMEQLLSDMQKEKGRMERLNKESIEARIRAEKAEKTYQEKEHRLTEKLDNQKLFIERNNHFIVLGKKMNDYVNNYVIGARGKTKNTVLFEELKKFLTIEKTKRLESVKKEKAKAQNNKVKTKPQVEKEVNNTPMPIIQIGSRVKIDKSKNLGTVEAIDTKNKTAVVVSGILKFTMPLDRLTVII